jgi:type I restriction enzyme S subunit
MQDGQSGLLPKLRFPEFLDEPIRTVSLGEVTEECIGRRGKQLTSAAIMGVSKADGIVPMEERLIGKDTTRYKLLSPDWFAYNPMRINIGSIARWRGDCDVLVSPDYMVFRCVDDHESGISADYLDQFRSSLHWERFVTGNGDGGVRIRIYYRDLALLSMGLPSLPEQRKIASCLSTLDELIGSQGRKVAALRTHKKGLMQQLFPREGETQPRLRFPEFLDAPEWECQTLGHLFETTTGGTPRRAEKAYWNGDIPWVTTSLVDFRVITEAEEFITKQGLDNSSAKLFPKGTVLMALYGQGKTRGQVAVLGIQATTNQACAAILPRTGIDPYFLFLNLSGRYEEIRSMSNSGGQENLSQTLVREIPFTFPNDPTEQYKITSLLTSLDELITAEMQKLEAFKTIKRGLMQQLFPYPE